MRSTSTSQCNYLYIYFILFIKLYGKKHQIKGPLVNIPAALKYITTTLPTCLLKHLHIV